MKSMTDASRLKILRSLTAFIIFGLVVSGITAFPLRWELDILASLVTSADSSLDPADYTGLQHWILKVRHGLHQTYDEFPFIAYGTDWLAFGHIVIALFFIPLWIDPVRYRANLVVGMAACVLIFPLAMICGPIRGIPFYWQLIDCSFGIVAGVVFGIMLWLTPKDSGSSETT
ncbi:MAG: hypothetical protein AAF585_07900 [Verrucomicrobiota bacterium]